MLRDPAASVDEAPASAEAGEPTSLQVGEQPSRRSVYYPLRRRARNIRDAGHAGYHDAETPWGGVVAAFDYARSADARAQRAGVYYQPAEEALIAAGRTLMALGDLITDVMHTWRPDQ